MDLNPEFANDAEEQALAEFCCQPESSIPLIDQDVESALYSHHYSRTQEEKNTGSVDLELHPSGYVPVVHNMTATCMLDCKLDLAKIACCTRNTEYNPKGLPGAIMRLVDPKSVALIFDSGKMVVMGTQTETDLRLAARRIAKIIKTIGFPVKFRNFKVVNMLATCDTGFPIRIEGVHFKHALRSYYEPEMFPGLVYRPKNPKVTIMVFVSGKVVLVGAKKYKDLVTAFENLYPSLVDFRKLDATPHRSSNFLVSTQTETNTKTQQTIEKEKI